MFERAKRVFKWWSDRRRNQIKHEIAELKSNISSSHIAIAKMVEDQKQRKLIYPAILKQEKDLLNRNELKLRKLRHRHSNVLHAVVV